MIESKKLVILESIEEARCFVSVLLPADNTYAAAEILSLQPNIQAYLRQNDIASFSSSDVTSARSHRDVMDKCEEIERYFNEIEADQLENYFVNAYFYYLVLIWRHFLWNIAILEGCLSQKRYNKVVCFKYDSVETGSPWIEDDQLFIGQLAEQYCEKNGIEFKALGAPGTEVQRTVTKKLPKWYLDMCTRISYWLVRAGAMIFSRRRSLLVPSFKYYMDRVCSELTSKNKDLKICSFYPGRTGLHEIKEALAIFICSLINRKINKSAHFLFPFMTFARNLSLLYNDDIQRNYLEEILAVTDSDKTTAFAFKGVDFSRPLYLKVKNDLNPYMLQLHFQAYGLEKGVVAAKPDCIISQMNLGIYAALGDISNKLGIPSVLISHGSHVLHSDSCAAREHRILALNILVGDYKYLAVQSPHARELTMQMVSDPGRIINIRPVLWGRKIDRTVKSNGEQLVIVHAGSLKMRHNRRFLYETADEFVQGLKDLCSAISGLSRLKLIIKFRSSDYELTLDSLKKLLQLPDNVVIETDRPFLDVLPEADLMTSFSSTTIEEALVNKVPVLLYGTDGRYSHIPTQPFGNGNAEINKAVVFVKDKDSLRHYFSLLNDQKDAFIKAKQDYKQHCFNETDAEKFANWCSRTLLSKED